MKQDMEYLGKWRLVREIGRGAYGIVYLAEGADGSCAAVKVCRRGDMSEDRYNRELRGAGLYKAIPPTVGLVSMRELVEEPWGFYSVMDLADDEFDRDVSQESAYRPKTLASVIEGEKALPLVESVKLAIALAKGLATLQRRHLLHRDIKPGNVLYVKGSPVISDPGLVVEDTEAVSLVGTPGYVPPENFTDATGDIYSLGLTLKAASFGRRLEDLDKGPALESDTGAKHFPAWWRILNKATDPTPSHRYQSAKALLKDLERLRRRILLLSLLGTRVARISIAAVVFAAFAAIAFAVVSSRRASNEIAKQTDEVIKPIKEEASSVLYQVHLAKFIQDVRVFVKECIFEEIYAIRVLARLEYDMKKLIEETNDESEKAKLTAKQAELSDIRKMLEDILIALYQERASVEDAVKAIDADTKKKLEGIVQVVGKKQSEGVTIATRSIDIGKLVYGEEWEHAPKISKPTSYYSLTQNEIFFELKSASKNVGAGGK